MTVDSASAKESVASGQSLPYLSLSEETILGQTTLSLSLHALLSFKLWD